MSTTTSARLAPRTTARPCMIISSSGTGTVLLVAVHDHAQAVADQQEIHERVGDRRRVGVIGRQRDDRLAPLAGGDFRRGDALMRHGRLSGHTLVLEAGHSLNATISRSMRGRKSRAASMVCEAAQPSVAEPVSTLDRDPAKAAFNLWRANRAA